jgi:hypothetical protein
MLPPSERSALYNGGNGLEHPFTAHLVDYTYLGLGSFVQADYKGPQVRWDLATGTGASRYAGLDRWGRAIDNRWRNYAAGADTDRIRHNYDRVGNRLYRENLVSKALGTPKYYDENYTYDGLYQLADVQRGLIDGTVVNFEQD